MRAWCISLRILERACRNMLIGIFDNCRNRLRQRFYENTKKSMSFFLYQRSFFYRFFKREPIQWHHSPKEDSAQKALSSVCRKSLFSPAWGRNTPSAQPVSVRFAPGNRGPSSKRAHFLRRWRRIARFPFLGFPRTPFLTVAENLLLYRQSQSPALSRGLLYFGADPAFLPADFSCILSYSRLK